MKSGLDHLVGYVGNAASLVTTETTAVGTGSGSLPTLATGTLVALAEQAATNAIASALPLGMVTIGLEIHLKSLASTPVGHNIQVQATVSEVANRKILFKILAFDERERIAEGTHERFVVEAERFLSRLAAKRPKG